MPHATINSLSARELVLQVADAIIAAEAYLSQADRDLGDGDHGLGMQRGMLAVKEKIAALDAAASLDKVFTTAGMAMMSSMGGASGVIFGSFYLGGGKAVVGKDEMGSVEYAAFLQSACDTVTARGKAKPGDKTMVDALHPATVMANSVTDQPLPEAAAKIAEAAEAGRDASKAMIATLGRAKTLGEASIGYPDAGACSVAIILRTISDFISA